MRLKDVAELQRGYVALIADQKFTKKNLIALVVPFRDKYGLTDKQALCIARKEYPLFQVCDLLSKPTTNGDYIRAMSDEELAKALYGMQKEVCRHIAIAVGFPPEELDFADEAPDILNWLKQPRRTDNV